MQLMDTKYCLHDNLESLSIFPLSFFSILFDKTKGINSYRHFSFISMNETKPANPKRWGIVFLIGS